MGVVFAMLFKATHYSFLIILLLNVNKIICRRFGGSGRSWGSGRGWGGGRGWGHGFSGGDSRPYSRPSCHHHHHFPSYDVPSDQPTSTTPRIADPSPRVSSPPPHNSDRPPRPIIFEVFADPAATVGPPKTVSTVGSGIGFDDYGQNPNAPKTGQELGPSKYNIPLNSAPNSQGTGPVRFGFGTLGQHPVTPPTYRSVNPVEQPKSNTPLHDGPPPPYSQGPPPFYNPTEYGPTPAYSPPWYGSPPAYSPGSYHQQYHQQYHHQEGDGGMTLINNNDNNYRGGYGGWAPSYPTYYPTSHNTGSGPLGFFLDYSLAKLQTPSYHLHNGYYGDKSYTPKFDHYTVHHYYHNKDTIPKEVTIQPNDIVQCDEDSGSFCPANTTSLCTNNGTVMCVASTVSTVPCTIDRQVNCVESTISCVNSAAPECKQSSQNTATRSIPCISTAKIYESISYVNNTIVVSFNTENVTSAATFANNTLLNASNTTVDAVSVQNITAANNTAEAEQPPLVFCVTILALPAEREPPPEGKLFGQSQSIFLTFANKVLGLP